MGSLALLFWAVAGFCFFNNLKRNFIMRRIEISEIQRGLKLKNGQIETILEPGRYWLLNPFAKIRVLAFDVNKVEFVSEWTDALLRSHQAIVARYFTVADVGDNQIGIVTQDGKFFRLVPPGQRVLFWNVLKNISVEYVDFSEFQEIDPAIAKVIVAKAPNAGELYFRLVPESHVGLLLVDGRFVKTLAPGPYTYWKGRTNVEVAVIDLRIQNMEVAGQEILTRDKVSLRLNLEAYFRIADPVKALKEIKDLKDYMHKELQFALRKIVGGRLLDEVLSRKESLGDEVSNAVREKFAVLGVELTSSGVKDVILPGDIREILNKVVSAEKQAQANLIRRREEVAATRSLLNTAKMMESSPALMKLKEMESIEKISEKIQSVNVFGGIADILGKVAK